VSERRHKKHECKLFLLSYFGIAHVIVDEIAPRFGSRSTCVVLFGKIVLSRDGHAANNKGRKQ
jgi:hypothetical protein